MEAIALLVSNCNKFRRKTIILPGIEVSCRNVQMQFEVVSLLLFSFYNVSDSFVLLVSKPEQQ